MRKGFTYLVAVVASIMSWGVAQSAPLERCVGSWWSSHYLLSITASCSRDGASAGWVGMSLGSMVGDRPCAEDSSVLGGYVYRSTSGLFGVATAACPSPLVPGTWSLVVAFDSVPNSPSSPYVSHDLRGAYRVTGFPNGTVVVEGVVVER